MVPILTTIVCSSNLSRNSFHISLHKKSRDSTAQKNFLALKIQTRVVRFQEPSIFCFLNSPNDALAPRLLGVPVTLESLEFLSGEFVGKRERISS